MAKFDRVPENAQMQVAAELGDLTQTLGGPQREVGETFPIFILNEKDIGIAHVTDAASPAHRLTSLIYEGGAPTCTSEAVLGGEDSVSVSYFPNEPNEDLARRFQAALARIDQDFPSDDGIVRQLEAPDFRFVAFWVQEGGEDWIYPIESGAVDALKPLKKYKWSEASVALSNAEPIIGLVDNT